jgi:primosomal protein N' (replication factor Y)
VKPLYADIVLRLAAPGTFQFSVPPHLADMIQPGQRVQVPLRNRRDIGYVASLSREPRVKGIRPVEAVIDREPLLPQDLLEVLLWTADHFLAPPGLVFRSALPRAIHLADTRGATAREKTVAVYHLTDRAAVGGEELEALRRRAPRQAAIIDRLARGPLPGPDLAGGAPLKALVEKGFVRVEHKTVRRGIVAPPSPPLPPPPLTAAQEEVFSALRPGLEEGSAGSFLIHGVTGSGKTEVYARALLALPPHRQAIVLVPEVSLTSHLVAHISERIGMGIAVWHHQLSDGEKHDLWNALRTGEVRVVIGARSAVFAPLPDLGLIIIDEEQESSYKQEETPSYHARDVAAKRCALKGATLVLGSATPSVESYHDARQGVHRLLRLSERYGGQPLPEVEIIDLREQRTKKSDWREGATGPPAISPPLREAASEVLDRGDQVFFFLNRRGFAPFTGCGDCGWSFKCPNCQVSLVYHRQERAHLCHYCAHSDVPPESCPACGGLNLRLSGAGTQRLEDEITETFPGHTVARLDRDTASRKGAGGRIVQDFAEGASSILVGTQLAAKGFHFPRLALVGILSPDVGLNMPDFRAAERSFQVVTQAAGRAGRGNTPGRVLIQTYQPDHYALRAAAAHDFEDFYARESEFRSQLDYPPNCQLILLRIDGPNAVRTGRAADEMAAWLRMSFTTLRKEGSATVLGPVPAPLARIRNRFRYHLLIKAAPLEPARLLLSREMEGLENMARKANGHVAVDVNPSNLM